MKLPFFAEPGRLGSFGTLARARLQMAGSCPAECAGLPARRVVRRVLVERVTGVGALPGTGPLLTQRVLEDQSVLLQVPAVPDARGLMKQFHSRVDGPLLIANGSPPEGPALSGLHHRWDAGDTTLKLPKVVFRPGAVSGWRHQEGSAAVGSRHRGVFSRPAAVRGKGGLKGIGKAGCMGAFAGPKETGCGNPE